jgi:hypothetical protein
VLIEIDGIVLQGESKDNTIIDGNNNRDIIKIDCNYLNISDFTIRNDGSDINIF